ncbi:hypothetical protein BJX65DRAFT_307862 [Aspergillus insuetus]
MTTNANNLSVAAFTALGTIVGYLGTEVASASMFNRLLWPSRFYNTKSPMSFLWISLLMPMGGPIHKAAVESLDEFVVAGLFKGYCRGDMLGTAFYEDTKHCYVIRMPDGSKGEQKVARNAFWITVLELVGWEAAIDQPMPSPTLNDELAERAVAQLRAQRPLFVLKLTRRSPVPIDTNMPVVEGDIGRLKLRYFAGIMASEITTLAVGIVTAAALKSLFSIWYLYPLILKLVSLFFCVRRETVEPRTHYLSYLFSKLIYRVLGIQEDVVESPTERAELGCSIQHLPSTNPQIVCEVVDISKGFFLIQGPSELVMQFFRHYGHPIRNRRGIRGDHIRELISMFTVVSFITVYPAALIAFIFAPVTVQWVWIGYQLYTMLAMHLYRFYGGVNIGTTQESVAKALSRHGRVCFIDHIGSQVFAYLERSMVSSVAEGRRAVESRVYQTLARTRPGDMCS